MKIIITCSGGKDSVAALLWMRNNGYKNADIVFCDTNWESDNHCVYVICSACGHEFCVRCEVYVCPKCRTKVK